MKRISVALGFSEFPGLRHCSISDYSGEEYYHKILNKTFADCINKKEKLEVDLDNTSGYASSFLDEAFGNLVYDFTLEIVINNIEIVSEQEPHWKDMLLNQTYKQWEERRKKAEPPVVTKDHSPWFRLINNNLELKVWEQPKTA